MPYDANGNFSPDMPASVTPLANPLAAPGTEAAPTPLVPINRHTGAPYGQSFKQGGAGDVLKSIPKPVVPKPGYAHQDVPMFPDYAKFAATRDKVDLGTADDATLLGYAKEYADQMLPQALLSKGHKVDKEYLKTLTPNFQFQTAQMLPQLRAHFAAEAAKNPPPPAEEGATGDFLKQAGGKTLETGGSILGATVRGLSDPFTLLGPMGPGIRALSTLLSPDVAKTVATSDTLRNKAISGAEGAVTGAGADVLKTTSPSFQAKEAEPFLHEKEPWVHPDGALNFGKFNLKAVNLPKLAGITEDTLLPLAAALITRNPEAVAPLFGAQQSEQALKGEQDRLGKLTDAEWQQVPAYVSKLHDGMDSQAAKDAVTQESAHAEQLLGAAQGTLTGLAAELPYFKPATGGIFKRVLTNYLKQAPAFSALASGGQAAGVEASNVITGEKRNPLAGLGETAVTAAVGAAPFAFAGGRGKPAEAAPKPGESAPADGQPAAAQATPEQAVPSAIASAFEENPIPTPKEAGQPAFTDPVEAKAHYDAALSAFRGSLRAEDIAADQVAAQTPAFNAAWKAQTGFDPAAFVAPEAGAPAPGEAAPAPTGTPEELATAAALAPEEGTGLPEVRDATEEMDLTGLGTGAEARGGVAAEELPVGVRTRAEEDLGTKLGREPTPEEVANHGQQLIDLILSDPRIDGTISKDALREAVGRLTEVSPELPPAKEVNALARKIEAAPPEDVLAKKAEAAPKDEEAATTEEAGKPEETLYRKEVPEGKENAISEEQHATPEERAKYQPLEDFYRRFKNAHDALADMANRLQQQGYSKLIRKVLANPYLRDVLSKTQIHIVNPGDKVTHFGGEGIGNRSNFYREAGKLFGATDAVWGSWNPRDGITLAGAGWKPHGPINNGLHPVTFIHEALHAALASTIRAIEKGQITDPAMRQAYNELEGIRMALRDHYEGLTTDKDTRTMLKYASEDGHSIHELLSVSLTDPRVQGVLSKIRVGTINAWQKLMGIYNKLLGGAPEDLPAITRIFDLAHKLLEYQPKNYKPVDEGATLQSRQSERVEENTASRVMDVLKPKSGKEEQKRQVEEQRNEGQPTRAQQLETKIFDKLKPLTHIIEKLRGMGQEVGPKENIDDSIRRYQNQASRATVIIQQQFITPALDKLVAMAKSAGKDPHEFLANLSAFYFGKRALEVNERGELESARLKKDAEIQRQQIKEDWAAGKLSDGKYIEALKKVVNAPGSRVANRTPIWKSGITDEVAHELIARAKKAGINLDTVNQFEPSRKAMVDQISANYRKSGRFTEADQKRLSGLASKWYMPLKGFGEAGDAADLEGSGIGAFTREYQAAGGRSSISENPILSLMQELQRSARDVPENEFTKTVYNFSKKFGKQLGIKTRTLDREKAIQDAIAAGKGLDEIGRIFKNENSVVHNAGDYHFSMEFPKSMQAQLEAIKGVNETPELNGALKRIGMLTNFISRGATTFQIPFLFWNAFWRDMGYVGSQVAMDLGPAAAARYAANYWLKGGPLRGRRTYFKGLTQVRNALERQELGESGESPFATSLLEMAKHGGDLSFENQLNQTRDMASIYDALEKAEKGGGIKEGALAVQHWLDQIGTSDIMTARVAAYEAYKSEALSKIKNPTSEQVEQIQKDGAMFSRRVLDYQQRSDVSRIMNIFFPFSRVVLNQTDRLLTTFKNADGSYNPRKAALFTALGMASGAAFYSLLRQAYPDIKKEEDGTLAKNWVIPIGDGKVLKIPMAYGLTRLFMLPGMMMARAAYGDTSNEDAANQVRNVVQEAFTPFRPNEPKHNERVADELADLLTAMSPGALRPLVDLERNENAFAAPITPSDQFTKGPHSDAGFRSTPEEWRWLAKMLHSTTAGAIDVYPESLRYLVSAYGTGPGNALIRGVAMQSGKETPISQFPLVPSVLSRDAEFYQGRVAREHMEDLEAKGANITDKEKEDLKALRSVSSRYGKERAAVDKNKLLGPAAKQKQIDEINQRQAAEQKTLLH